MAEIAIDFLLGPDLSSRFIAWFGDGTGGYSHAASVLSDGRYLDARSGWCGDVPPGVHIRHPQDEAWIKRRRATLEVTEDEYVAWEANLRAKITDGYGGDDIWDFILGHSGHVDGHWICSALAINAVQHIKKVPYPLVLPAHAITPTACLLIVQTAGFMIGPEIFA